MLSLRYINSLVQQELARVHLVLPSATSVCRHQDVSDVYLFVVLKHLKHLLSVLKFVAELLGPDKVRLHYRSLHVELHPLLLEDLSLIVILTLLLQHLISLLCQPNGSLPDLGSPLLEPFLVLNQPGLLAFKCLPVSREQLLLLLEEPPLLPQFTLMLAHCLSTLLYLNLDYLQVSELALPEVCLVLLAILCQTRLHVLDLILFVLDVHVSNTFLGTPPLLFSLKSLLLHSEKFLGFALEDSLFVEFDLIC